MSSSDSAIPTVSLGHVVVTGGAGFLGNHIIKLLATRKVCSKITCFDLRVPATPIPGVDYKTGDLTDYDGMLALFKQLRPDGVIHTASPPPMNNKNHEFMYKVNVEGTQTMLRVSQETGVKAFVYTSSASVIHDTVSDLVNADETYPLVMGKDQPLYYTTTKAQAELAVTAANRTPEFPKFLTASIRPSGMFGEGDAQLLPAGLSAYYKGQTKFQIGPNDNLFDFTEITNVAHAHHLCLAALMVTRNREDKGQTAPLDHEKVDGESFFITNDNPVHFFDFARKCWAAAGDRTDPKSVWVLSKGFGLFVATLMEWIFWALGLGTPNLTREQVKYTCMTRYYNVSKAKQRLGYKPVVDLDWGIKRGVKDALFRGVVKGQPMELKGKAYELHDL